MIKFRPIWADSLGAKSFSIFIEAGGASILIDPGVAKMQPGYPADKEFKTKCWSEARNLITEYLSKANNVVITHYHHDHYFWQDADIVKYYGKHLFIKNPNKYINDSQRNRAFLFLNQIIRYIVSDDVEKYLVDPREKTFIDYVENYHEALNLDLGDYNKRRQELLEKGRKWFESRINVWISNPWFKEFSCDKIKISFIDGKQVTIGDLKLRFTEPLFHGIEYSRVGWVIALVIEYIGDKIIYTSDIQGPTVEDYATWIINENPRVLILDGPPTYLIPYSMNLYNFRRTIKNLIKIINLTENLKLIIYDHHLTREPKYRNKVHDVYLAAKEKGIEVLTVAEYLGVESAFEKLGLT